MTCRSLLTLWLRLSAMRFVLRLPRMRLLSSGLHRASVARWLCGVASVGALLMTGAAQAGEAAPLAEDPVVEARLVEISQELRCLVCQNESLASSRAELADDLRREVRELIRSGKSDAEIKDFLVARYGDFVLYRPAVKPLTWVLWFGPFLLLLIALGGLFVYVCQRRAQVPPPSLTDEQRRRAQDLLKG